MMCRKTPHLHERVQQRLDIFIRSIMLARNRRANICSAPTITGKMLRVLFSYLQTCGGFFYFRVFQVGTVWFRWTAGICTTWFNFPTKNALTWLREERRGDERGAGVYSSQLGLQSWGMVALQPQWKSCFVKSETFFVLLQVQHEKWAWGVNTVWSCASCCDQHFYLVETCITTGWCSAVQYVATAQHVNLNPLKDSPRMLQETRMLQDTAVKYEQPEVDRSIVDLMNETADAEQLIKVHVRCCACSFWQWISETSVRLRCIKVAFRCSDNTGETITSAKMLWFVWAEGFYLS